MKKEFMIFLKEILLRVRAESPKLFKRITWLCGIMTLVGVGLKAEGIDWIFYESVKHPQNVISLVNLMIGGGVIGGAISSITAKNTEKITEMKEQNK